MVIDTSALVAVLLNEPERQQLLEAILADGVRLLSAVNLVEAGIVLEARVGQSAGRELDIFLHHLQVEVVPVDASQAEIARSAWRRFGRGNHPAKLNFGDCFAFALARNSGERLLAKGQDFSKTDIAMC